MPLTLADMMQAANAAIPRITASQAQEKIASGAILLDIRDGDEVAATGLAAGAIHIPRGMLEFRADPASPAIHPELAFDRPIILHCASGGRAALAGKLLKDMGYDAVYNLGGLKDWIEGGGALAD